jgi:hypothetical protein
MENKEMAKGKEAITDIARATVKDRRVVKT